MASFVLFNYQFSRIDGYRKDQYFDPSFSPILMDSEESFPQRQEILDKLFLDDFDKKNEITFFRRNKIHVHKHLMRPTDHIIVFRLANKRVMTRTTEDLKKVEMDDYPYCHVIIDNRPGIQRMALEIKKKAFQDVKTMANIISETLNKYLNPYSLGIELFHLQDSRTFWTYVNDNINYYQGFYRVHFSLPYLNLERLQKTYNRLLTESRKMFDAKLDWDFTANEGGKLNLDEKDERQNELIKWMMEDVGGENIKLYPNDNRRRAIIVGKNSYDLIYLSDKTLQDIVIDFINQKFIDSEALNEIKRKMKKNIG